MGSDEQAIRDLVANWLAASKAGDTNAMLSMMADDVVFMTPGREPFGKEAFAGQSKNMRGISIDGKSKIAEIQVMGDWAWMRNHLTVTMSPPGGQTIVLSGWILSILRKNAQGTWQLARDANLLMPANKGN